MKFLELFVCSIVVSFLSVGCMELGPSVHIPSGAGVKTKHHKHGPPPHAPAHGYRHKHKHGVVLEYDTGLGVYVVVELPGTYYHDGLYIRLSSNRKWEVTARLNGPWRIAVKGEVPPKLKKSKGKGHPGKGKGKK